MNLESHLATLQRRHGELEAELSDLRSSPSTDDVEIVRVKRRKLAVKDEIARVESRLH